MRDVRHAHALLIQHGCAVVMMMPSHAARLPFYQLDGIYVVQFRACALRGVMCDITLPQRFDLAVCDMFVFLSEEHVSRIETNIHQFGEDPCITHLGTVCHAPSLCHSI